MSLGTDIQHMKVNFKYRMPTTKTYYESKVLHTNNEVLVKSGKLGLTWQTVRREKWQRSY